MLRNNKTILAWQVVYVTTCVAAVVACLFVIGNFITGIITVEEVKSEGHGIKVLGKMAEGQALLKQQLGDLQKSAKTQAQQNSALLNKLDHLQQPGSAVNSEGRWDPIQIDYSNTPVLDAGLNTVIQGPPRRLDVDDDPNAYWPLNVDGVSSCVAISPLNSSRYFTTWLGNRLTDGVYTSSSANNFAQVLLTGGVVLLTPSQLMSFGPTDFPYGCAIGPRLYNGQWTFNCGGQYCDRFYLASRHFTGHQIGVNTMMYHSDDGGATWSGPRSLYNTPGSSIASVRQGFDHTTVEVNVDQQHSEFGTVYLVGESASLALSTIPKVNVFMSRDGGLTFDLVKSLSLGTANFKDTDPATTDDQNSWPYLKIADDGGIIVVARAGSEASGRAAVWRVSADGKKVELDKTQFAMDQEGSFFRLLIFGNSELFPVYLQGPTSAFNCFCMFPPTVATSGQRVYVLWHVLYSRNADHPLTRYFMATSTDSGRSYGAPVEVMNNDLNHPGYFPNTKAIVAWGSHIAMVTHLVENAANRHDPPALGIDQGIAIIMSDDNGVTFNQANFLVKNLQWTSATTIHGGPYTTGTFQLGIAHIPGTNCVRVVYWQPRFGIKECVPSGWATNSNGVLTGDPPAGLDAYVAGFGVTECGNNTYTGTPVPFPFFTGGFLCNIQEDCDVYGVAGIGGARFGHLEVYTDFACAA